jgi:UDP-N-acetyl-D-glucosamine dehydrogenase
MPEYVVQRTMNTLNERGKALNGAKILIIGLAYKAEVDDDRESPSYRLIELFKEKLAVVDYYDPYVPVIRPSREHAHLSGKESVNWNNETIGGYDAIVVSTAHERVNYEELAQWGQCIIDTRNVMQGVPIQDGKLTKA